MSIYWSMFGTGDALKDEYWNAKWKILSEYWEDATLKEMYRDFKNTKWNKMNWEIYSKYHKEEIQQKQKENYEINKQEILEKQKQYYNNNKEKLNEKHKIYIDKNREEIYRRNREHFKSITVKCECGGTYVDVPTKRNRHMNTLKHKQWKESKK